MTTPMPDWFRSKRSRTASSSSSSLSSYHSEHGTETARPWPAVAAAAAAAAIAAYAGYELHRSIRTHGWEGTLRYVWEGDPYDPELREAVDRLEDAEWDLAAVVDDRLSGLEASLDAATGTGATEFANANFSNANPNTKESVVTLWNRVWMDHPLNNGSGTRSGSSNDPNNYETATPLTVERTLADTSDRLDKIAARVDGVIVGTSSSSSSSSNSFLMQRVKQRKKLVSKTIVSNMERCDALMTSFRVLRERTKS